MLDLLVVAAHPDDETLIAGPLIAAITERGGLSAILCATNGAAGFFSATALNNANQLAQTRQAELRAAAEALGTNDVRFLGFSDGGSSGEVAAQGLLTANIDGASARIAEVILETSPLMIVTHPQDDPDGHPDHLAVSRAVSQAVATARAQGSAEIQLYFSAFPDSARRKIVRDSTAEQRSHHVRFFDLSLTAPTGCSLEVPITAAAARRVSAAIRAHASQERSLSPLRELIDQGRDDLALGFNAAYLD